ncbi:MAG: Fe-S cluster assembly sulfur transfer protein SufU [Pseudomonadota bacterium]
MSTADLAQLYRDQVLQHSRAPTHRRRVDNATMAVTGNNPLCGDKLTVYLTLHADTIADVSFEGSGCAISVASASMLSEMLSGVERPHAQQLINDTLSWLGSAIDTPPPTQLAKTPISALAAVRQYPSRVKCATLAWHAAANATHNQSTTVTTE